MSQFQGVFDFSEDLMVDMSFAMDDAFGRASFINFPDPILKNYHERYYGDNYRKLQEIKAKYDPENLFESSLGIVPITKDAEAIHERNTFEADNPKIYMRGKELKIEEELEEDRWDDTQVYEKGVVKTGEGVKTEVELSAAEAKKEEIRKEEEKEEKKKSKNSSSSSGTSPVLIFFIILAVLGLCGYLAKEYLLAPSNDGGGGGGGIGGLASSGGKTYTSIATSADSLVNDI